jgi:hypothetical protein
MSVMAIFNQPVGQVRYYKRVINKQTYNTLYAP